MHHVMRGKRERPLENPARIASQSEAPSFPTIDRSQALGRSEYPGKRWLYGFHTAQIKATVTRRHVFLAFTLALTTWLLLLNWPRRRGRIVVLQHHPLALRLRCPLAPTPSSVFHHTLAILRGATWSLVIGAPVILDRRPRSRCTLWDLDQAVVVERYSLCTSMDSWAGRRASRASQHTSTTFLALL